MNYRRNKKEIIYVLTLSGYEYRESAQGSADRNIMGTILNKCIILNILVKEKVKINRLN